MHIKQDFAGRLSLPSGRADTGGSGAGVKTHACCAAAPGTTTSAGICSRPTAITIRPRIATTTTASVVCWSFRRRLHGGGTNRNPKIGEAPGGTFLPGQSQEATKPPAPRPAGKWTCRRTMPAATREKTRRPPWRRGGASRLWLEVTAASVGAHHFSNDFSHPPVMRPISSIFEMANNNCCWEMNCRS